MSTSPSNNQSAKPDANETDVEPQPQSDADNNAPKYDFVPPEGC